MFSIIIPTFNNLDYVKILLLSLKKNSTLNHEIIFHVNEGSDGTINFLNQYTKAEWNLSLKYAVNKFLRESENSKKYLKYFKKVSDFVIIFPRIFNLPKSP